jgi:hypothetical protein
MGFLLTSLGAGICGFVYARKRVNGQVRPQRSGALIWLDKPEKEHSTADLLPDPSST